MSHYYIQPMVTKGNEMISIEIFDLKWAKRLKLELKLQISYHHLIYEW